MTTPTTEPASVIAGDTVSWQKSFADYLATDGWTLKYRLLNAAGKIDITAGASSADHLVNLTAATTALWVAGDYDYIGWVENAAAARHTVVQGRMTVRPNLATSPTYDGLSQARQILETLKSSYKTYVTNGSAHVIELEIAGRRTKFRNAAEILQQIDYWSGIVVSEEKAERIRNGLKARNNIRVRF